MTAGPGDELPPHQPNCFGCGPRNAAGLHVRCRLTDTGVEARVSLDEQHEGGPGLAHGGIVAAVLDDVMGFLMHHHGRPAVTARLELDFRRPVPIGVELLASARIVAQEGRKVRAHGVLADSDGNILSEGAGLFVAVDLSHFVRAAPEAMRRLAARFEDGSPPIGP